MEPPLHYRVVYDRFAPCYDDAMRPLERLLFGRLRARTLAALPESGRILEVGVGTGVNFQHYPRGARGVATDLSREMIAIARRKRRPENVRLVQNGAEALPFRDDSFDAAFATLVFCSVVSPRKAFREIRRVVRPGGTVALLEHVRPEGLLGPLFDLLSLLTVAVFNDHFNRRTADEARRAGLNVIRTEQHAAGIVNVIVCRV